MRPRPRIRFAIVAAAVTAMTACENSTTIESKLTYVATMNGASEKPTATTSTATGSATLVASSEGTLTYTVSWSGLTGTAIAAHIHGPADASGTANVIVDFSAPPLLTQDEMFDGGATGSASGILDVRTNAVVTSSISGDSLLKLLDRGLLYVNVHTTANSDGEIRGQLHKQ